MLLLILLSFLLVTGNGFVVTSPAAPQQQPGRCIPSPGAASTPSQQRRLSHGLSSKDLIGGSRMAYVAFGSTASTSRRQRQNHVSPRYPLLIRLAGTNDHTDKEDGLHEKSHPTYSNEEILEMEQLIVSLSQESTDVQRRHRLQQIFDKQLNKPNGATQRFCTLFDSTLIVVGDRVKLQVQQLTLSSESSNVESTTTTASNDADDEPSGNMLPIQTTSEGWQLWALIDMMVQSKTIVKKAKGELGKEGAFG